MSRGRSVSFHLGAPRTGSVATAATNSSENNAASASRASSIADTEGNLGRSSILFGGASQAGLSSVRQTRLFRRGWTPTADDDAGSSQPSFTRRPNDSPSSRTTTSRTRFTRLSDVRPTLPARLRRGRQAPPRHVVCAISENLARETCVTSMDTHAPNTTLSASRQGNGLAYAETLACLRVLQPDEVLLNEGRRSSQLVRKVLELYRHDPDQPVDWMVDDPKQTAGGKKRGSKRPRGRSGFAEARTLHHGNNDEEHEELDSLASNPAPLLGREEGTTKTVVKFVSRGLFDQTRGAAMLRLLARHDTYDPSLLEEYILLSSAHAVIGYSQMVLGASFAPHSLQLFLSAGACDDGERFRSLSNPRMMIDRTSQWQLELLVNSKTGKTQPSLMATIDKTKTSVGSRLLRSNLMAPPTRIDTIESRLELVDTFLQSSDFFFEVYEHLESLPDVDKMLSNITLVPPEISAGNEDEQPSEQLVRLAGKGIASLVSIKAVLSSVPRLASSLQARLTALDGESTSRPSQRDDDAGTAARSSLLVGLGTATPANMTSGDGAPSGRNHLLRAIVSVLQQPQLSSLHQLVNNVYTASTTYERSAHARQHQECFALKDDNGLLTALRRAYVSNVDEIYRAADELAEQYNLPVTVRYTASKGYCLSIPVTALASGDLPNDCLHPVKSGKNILFETIHVASLNARIRDNVRDLLVFTHEGIEGVLKQARDPAYYDALAALCDAIALLDLCHGFADVVSLSKLPWCRPLVFDDRSRERNSRTTPGRPPSHSGGSFIIKSGRYPIDVALRATREASEEGGAGDFIPNDTFVGDGKRFTVVTGVNGAGKTTYLKQVAIISILAHIGCYVPAEQASIPLFDRLCTRIGNADDQEHNISTFMLEMKETAFICSSATDRSLILLDELGRATSNEDGVAIAWAVSEYLMSRQSTVFFVTHYPHLTRLAEVYSPLVQNIHLEADLKQEGTGNQLLYTHKVKAGTCNVSSEYGVELAAYCGWTQDVLDQARAHETRVSSLLPDEYICKSNDASTRSFAYTNVWEFMNNIKGFASDITRIQVSTTLEEFLDATQSRAYDTLKSDPAAEDEILNRLLRLSPGSAPYLSPRHGHRRSGSQENQEEERVERSEGTTDNHVDEISLLHSPQCDDARSRNSFSVHSGSTSSTSSPSSSTSSSTSSGSSSSPSSSSSSASED